MNKKLILLVILLFASIHVSYSQEWNYIGASVSNEFFYMNSSYLSKDGQTIKIWVKKEFEKQIYVKKGKSKVRKKVMNEEKILYEFDCENQKLMIHYRIVYNSAGIAVETYDPLDYQKEWRVIIPGSVGEGLSEKACEFLN